MVNTTSDEKPKPQGFRATPYQESLIDTAAKLDNRSKSAFILHSALIRAKKVIRDHNDHAFLARQKTAGDFAVSDGMK